MQKWEYKTMWLNGDGDKLYVDSVVVASGQSIKVLPYLQQPSVTIMMRQEEPII